MLDIDACDVPVRCMLSQGQAEKTKKSVGFWSESHTKLEKANDTTPRDCLTILWSKLLLPLYLEESRFTIGTNHNSLRSILNLADASGRLARWPLRMLDSEFDIVH